MEWNTQNGIAPFSVREISNLLAIINMLVHLSNLFSEANNRKFFHSMIL